MPTRLDADLTIDGPDGRIVVRGAPDVVRITLPDRTDLASARRVSGRLTSVVARALRRVGLTADVVHRERRVARLGARARPGLVSWLVGHRDVEFRLGALLRLLVGR